MNRLKEDHKLFLALDKDRVDLPYWWRNIISDRELSVQIRKDNTIDVYFNGGALMTGLSFSGRKFLSRINESYVAPADYLSYDFGESVTVRRQAVIDFENFSKDHLNKIKRRILNHYPTESEKGIQYAFILNDPAYIDSELQFVGAKSNLRIDLMRVDLKSKLLVAVEVKTVGDNRLFNGKIVTQLKDYANFMKENASALQAFYQKVIHIKRRLGILPEALQGFNDRNIRICTKPLLLFGDCEQKWITVNAPGLDQQIKPHAVGSYYFGKPEYDASLRAASRGNRHIFINIFDPSSRECIRSGIPSAVAGVNN